jgi:hypothetical protein
LVKKECSIAFSPLKSAFSFALCSGIIAHKKPNVNLFSTISKNVIFNKIKRFFSLNLTVYYLLLGVVFRAQKWYTERVPPLQTDILYIERTPTKIRRGSILSDESVSVNAYLLLRSGLVLKLNLTIDQSKQGVVLAHANVFAGAYSGTSLSDDDVAGNNCLTVSLLYAKALGLTVTTVLGRTDTLLMSKEL